MPARTRHIRIAPSQVFFGLALLGFVGRLIGWVRGPDAIMLVGLFVVIGIVCLVAEIRRARSA